NQVVPHLPNAANDAELIAGRLARAPYQFNVFCGTNMSFAQTQALLEAAHSVVEEMRSPLGSVIVFYFAGHGYSSGGRTYLVPDEAVFDPGTHEISLVSIRSLLWPHDQSITLLFFDMCRNVVAFLRNGQAVRSTVGNIDEIPGGMPTSPVGMFTA